MGGFDSPRGGRGTFGSVGTAQATRIEADFTGTDCQAAAFTGRVVLTSSRGGRHGHRQGRTGQVPSHRVHPDDWVAVFLKSHDTGGAAQRVGPLSLICHPRFQAWLRAQNARRFRVYVSINAIHPQRRARTREAIGEVRHVFLEADKDGEGVLQAIGARRDLPLPSYVIRSSPGRLHVLWQVAGFTKEGAEAVQKQLATEIGTDKAATSCAQLTRLPGFLNHKYTPGCEVVADYADTTRPSSPDRFSGPKSNPVPQHPVNGRADRLERARRYVAAIPPAVSGQRGISPPSKSAAGSFEASRSPRTRRSQLFRSGTPPVGRHGRSGNCGRSCNLRDVQARSR